MTISEMKACKKELGLTNAQVAEGSGLPLSTVQKVFSGATPTPRISTLSALESFFYERCVSYDHEDLAAADTVRETAAQYKTDGSSAVSVEKKQGEYTVEDYLAIPDDRRVELIDGVIYDMAAPSFQHQIIVNRINYQLSSFIYSHGGKCIPMISPADVQLDMDDKTMVQPDLFIICHPENIRDGRYFGAPDFIAEVLSPSTSRRDLALKLHKYIEANVREYWIVDPASGTVLTYKIDPDTVQFLTYSFDDDIPVRIYNGECIIHFKEIREQLEAIGWHIS